MSLEAYQNTWLALMLAPHEREQILAQCPAELNAEAYVSLTHIPQARLEAISDAVQRGRISVLSASLPVYLRQLIPPDLVQLLASRYAYDYPSAIVYPPAKGLYNWLNWLAAQPELSENLPLQDLIAYELGLTQLQFFRRPTSTKLSVQTSTGLSIQTSTKLSVQTSTGLSVLPGPRLSPRTGLIVASPDLDRLLQALESGQIAAFLAQFSPNPQAAHPLALPQQGWLLARWGSEIERIALHWSVYALLRHLDGQKSWTEAVHATVQDHPELAGQTSALHAWFGWFQKKGLLA